MRVRAYVDGFNFYYRTKAHVAASEPDLRWRWVDIARLVRLPVVRHWPKASLEHIYYFTAPVRMRFPGDGAGDRQERYLRLLAALGVDVIRGQFRLDAVRALLLTNPDDPRSITPDRARVAVQRSEEKGSDVNLATQLLIDYFTNRDAFDGSVVISNDSDLARPVSYLRAAGWPVGVVSPDPAPTTKLSPAGLVGPHFSCRIELEDLRIAQMTDPATDGDGRIIRNRKGMPYRKPDAW